MTESKLTNLTTPWDLGGQGKIRDDLTIEQDAGRGTAILYFLTVMAKESSSGKLVPLTSVDPAMTSANMVCGAIGGTAAEFAALTDAELSIDVDGETIELADMDMSGLDSAADTPGYMTCGAIGATLPEMAAVADGQFNIGFDGNAVTNITCDFSGIDTVEDTPGFWTCGTNGDVIGNWDALTDAAFSYVVDGVAYDTGQMNLTLSVTFDGLVNIVNYYLDGHATLTYGYTANIFKLTSNKTGETSSVTIGAPAAGTDISAAGYLNAAAGAATAGTGGENLGQTPTSIINAELAGLGTCYFDGDAFVFISRTAGEVSAVSYLTAGTGGTDISGAGFLNGLTGTGVITAGAGGEGLYESISGIINAHAAGRFTCFFNGDAFVFVSPTAGLPESLITVLSDPAAGGTDISGAAFLNGLTGTGTVTAATGSDGTDKPAGIYMGNDIAAATLIAGDVDDQALLVGSDKMLDEDMIILENSLTLASIVVSTGRTIREELELMGIYPRKSINDQMIQPIA